MRKNSRNSEVHVLRRGKQGACGERGGIAEQTYKKGRYGRGAVFVWLVADHPHPHDNVEGLRAVTGGGRKDERHALSDQLKLLLPVVQRGLAVVCQSVLPSESLCEPPRLRALRVRLRREAHQHKEESG